MAGTVSRRASVRSAAQEAFAAFVEVPQVLSWLADGAVIGARRGGGWRLGFYADPESDSGYLLIGVLSEFEPGRRLVVSDLTFSNPEGLELGPMTLTVDFSEATPGETLVVVTQEGIVDAPEWDTYRAGIGAGWERSLADLRGWLEEGRKLPGR